MDNDVHLNGIIPDLESQIAFNKKIRDAAFDSLGEKIRDNQGNNALTGIIVLRLLSLPDINRMFGFNQGDAFLARCISSIRQALLPEDSIFRIGEHDLLVCLSKTINEGHAILAAHKLAGTFGRPVPVGTGHITSKVAMGIAICPIHAGTSEELVKKALTAVDSAIREGTAYAVCSDEYEHARKLHIVIETELKNAIHENTFTLHYQPKLDIRNNTITGVEALARWTSPTHGELSPDYFIPLAEQAGLIDDLTLSIFNMTLKESREWQIPDIGLITSINLSAINLQNSSLVEMIKRAVNIWDARPEKLIFEVTESAMMLNPELSLTILNQINDLGIRCAIDDFGTGYSSLAYLKRLPVSELKIDKSFVMNMADDKEDTIIAGAIIELAHNFDMVVTAEGVEDEITLGKLGDMNCDFAQGYHIARPMSAEECKQWLAENVSFNGGRK